MPELPEVETVKNQLCKIVLNKKIASVDVFSTNLKIPVNPDNLQKLVEKQISAIQRKGKYLLFRFVGSNLGLVVHLAMAGKLIFQKHPQAVATHEICRFAFADGSSLSYFDHRHFGVVDVVDFNHLPKYLTNVAPDPFEEAWNADTFYQALQKKAAPIKSVLLDQHIISGIGNIYACEALFMSQINPWTSAKNVTKDQASVLLENIKEVLKLGISTGGASFRDYQQLDGGVGNFQSFNKVYSRAGKKCLGLACIEIITVQKLGGRSTYFCIVCQKK